MACGYLLVCSLVLVSAIQIAVHQTKKSHQIHACQYDSSNNFRYSRYIRVISCIGPEPIHPIINLEVISFYNFFTILIYVFRCKGTIVLNQ